jgi:hypothetical protein
MIGLVFSLAAVLIPVAEPTQSLAAPPGIATRYARDGGIEKDADVVFVEDFEEPTLEAMKKRWETVGNDSILSFSNDTPVPGGKSLEMQHVGGKGAGGSLYRRLMPGYDKIFVRFYVKFDPDYGPNHHFFHVGGYNPPTQWAQGGAGTRPKGDERFTVGVEPFGNDWTWDYYAYWKRMRGSPPRGQTWGNTFIQNPELKVAKGKWTCMELMIKLNDVGDTNGELALWIDGKQVSHLGKGFPKGMWTFDRFYPNKGGEGITWNDAKGDRKPLSFPPGGAPFEGFEWRSSEKLNINFLWVLNYITDAPAGHLSKVWFDQIVVAKRYIGPLK